MDIDEAKIIVTKIENDYGVNDFIVSKCQPWPICIESVMDYLMKNNEKKFNGIQLSVKKMNTMLGRMAKYFAFNSKITKTDVLCVSSSRFRVGNNSDSMANLYFDDLLANKPNDISSVFLETPCLNEYDSRYKNANYANVMPVDYIFFKSIIYRIICKKEINAISNKIDLIFENHLNYDSNLIEFIKKQLKIISIKIYTLNKAYKKLINKISPKVVIQIGGSQTYFSEYLDKVPIIEFQHGLISKYHHIGGYIKEKQLIDEDTYYMIVYNKYYQKLLPQITKLKKDNILVYEYLKMINIKDNSSKLRTRLGIQNKKVILFTSQPLQKAQEKISSVAKEFLELIKERNTNEYKIIIKLHPREELCDNYRALKEVTFLKQEYRLYDLLMVTDVHLSYFSTVIEEASLLNIPNFILCKQGAFERFGYLINEQKAIIYENIEQLVTISLVSSEENNKNKISVKNQYVEIWDKIKEVIKYGH